MSANKPIWSGFGPSLHSGQPASMAAPGSTHTALMEGMFVFRRASEAARVEAAVTVAA